MITWLSSWWHGEVKTYDSPNLIGIYTERHWTSNLAHTLVDFYLKHWQWVWGTALAIVAILIAL